MTQQMIRRRHYARTPIKGAVYRPRRIRREWAGRDAIKEVA